MVSFLYKIISCTLFITVFLSFPSVAQNHQNTILGKVSGLPIPRFVSLKSDRVNIRVGPGRQYPIAWTFRQAGYPVEIVAEFENWRKIRDGEGEEGWVFHGLLSGRRTAVITPWEAQTPLPARKDPTDIARIVYLLEPNILADIRLCRKQWCLLQGRFNDENWEAWVKQDKLWGTYPNEVIE